MARERIEITGYAIVFLEDRLEPIEALRELFENSHKEKASVIDVKITSEILVFTDNGTGCDDPNLLITPSESLSRYDTEGTGSKGIGLKEAAATFGRTWEFHTVTRAGRDIGQYRHHKVTWDGIRLPFKYVDNPKPAVGAPADIRGGGTKIIITDRKEGFPRLSINRLAGWCRSLEETYRPALGDRTLSVTVSNPDIAFKQKLRNTASDKDKFTEAVRQIGIKVSGRPLTVRYATLKQTDDTLGGCHYIFGPRVIDAVPKINGHSLPLRCYIDVILGAEWKPMLSTNKDRFRYRDETEEAVWQHLKAWIEQQEKEEKSFAIQIQLGAAAKPVNEIIAMLNTEKEGTWQAKPIEKKKRIGIKQKGKEKPEIVVHREYNAVRRRRAIQGGIFGVTKIDRSHRCLLIEPRPALLGKKLWHAAVSTEEGKAFIYINTDPEQMPGMAEKIAHHPDQLTDILCIAYANSAALDPEDFEGTFAGLRARGYAIDELTPQEEIRQMVANFFVSELSKQKAKRLRAVA